MIAVHPLTPDRAADAVALFGPSGACWGCWCSWFLEPRAIRDALGPEGRKARFLADIAAGPPPGVLAYDGAGPVGWLRIGPRAAVPQWNNTRRASSPLPDAPAGDMGVWAAACLFVGRSARGRGITRALLAGGITWARDQGARLIEAAPMDRPGRADPMSAFVGWAPVFRDAGFIEVARHKPGRPLMRLVL